MAKKKKSSKDVMLPHSDAKVTFYEKYLERYLAIMSVSKWQNRINIFDVFCGRGVYEDGGLGSPIRAVQVIKKTKIEHPSNTRFHLYLNDLDTHHTENVKQYLDAHIPDHQQHVEIHYSNVDAEGLLDRLCASLPTEWRSCPGAESRTGGTPPATSRPLDLASTCSNGAT